MLRSTHPLLKLVADDGTTVVYTSNVGLNNETAMAIPEDQMETYKIGSICAFIAWVSYVLAVWAFKAVLVFLYNRLT